MHATVQSDGDALTLRGVIEAVYYAGPRFSAGRLRTDAGETVPFAGQLFARPHDAVIVRGHWGTHPRYGW